MNSRMILSSVCILFATATWAATSEDLPEGSSQTSERIARQEAIRILLVGDSTVANYPDERLERGWGQFFPESFDDRVSFFNAAKGGQSSKSFMDTGLWEKALEFHPNYVFIQFGHNDQPGKGADRETDPATTYREYLRKYIADARKAGAQPILVTSVVRRSFRNGKIVSSLIPWVEAMKDVAREEKVPLIDLHGVSLAYFEERGEGNSAELDSGKPNDKTHFSEKGARVVGGLVVAELPKAVPQLAAFLQRQP